MTLVRLLRFRLHGVPFVGNVVLLIVQATALIVWYRSDSNVSCPKATEKGTPPPEPPADRSWTWNMDWDGLNGFYESQDPKHKFYLRRLYLVRHGHYYGFGEKMGHLTPQGQKQAHYTGSRLSTMNVTFHKFIASTSIRADETAQILQKYIPYLNIQKTYLLREGKPNFPDPPIPFWERRDPQFEEDGKRLANAYRTFIHRANSEQTQDTNELIVAHGNVISFIILKVLQLPPERWLQIAIMQGSISLLEIYPNGLVSVRILGDVGHIPRREWTG